MKFHVYFFFLESVFEVIKRKTNLNFVRNLNNYIVPLSVPMDECEDRVRCYPEWRPFDNTNERFMHTPTDSRLPPPVMLENKTIVFKHASERYPEWRPFDNTNKRFMHTPTDSRLPPPVILANKTIVFYCGIDK